jgi:glyoxylase-like metal-dependent hydrolase (beta-lactamase superfamily II)
MLNIHTIFDTDSHTYTYVVWDGETKKSAVIDSVLDYNHKNVTTSTKLADKVIEFIKANNQ